MKFTKMHGAGNDYVYVNLFEETLPTEAPALARAVSDRHKGIGGDGLVLIEPFENADARMRMFNLDGSEAEMCGNAIRCVAKYLYDHGIAKKDNLQIQTGTGLLHLELFPENGIVERVRVNMGEPILESAKIPTLLAGDPPVNATLIVGGMELQVTCVSMGNPHCVTFVDELTDDLVLKIGPQIEKHEVFPRKINAEFIQVISPEEFNMRVWERGSGETMACGTGASAVAVAGVLTGKMSRKVTGHLLGGNLELEWSEETNEVFMTGPATEVFSGEWNG
ncbi:diaminopimelate epimerase [Rubinisphaera italica]|uniref:Diaminopimelate epimerase n=1 Tax=Rubinisphaera italica TaxID=2527969 RepID=A0A5C5XIL7_9PLAN|nr:diaminopimelate epimerase [Rubinisphaera italica]TWT62538.1 Diaminopimelate epimerase [Rubinisphaera italica]